MTARAATGTPQLRQRIVAEATRLFAEQGYAATSVRQVVEASGCTKPALYYYFDSKDALFRELVEMHVATVTEVLEEWAGSGETVRASAHRAASRVIDYASANPDIMRLLQRIEMRAEQGAPEINLMAARDMHLQLISRLIEKGIREGQIRRGVDALDCALVLAGAMSFQFELSLYTNTWERQRIHRTIDLIFDGIGA